MVSQSNHTFTLPFGQITLRQAQGDIGDFFTSSPTLHCHMAQCYYSRIFFFIPALFLSFPRRWESNLFKDFLDTFTRDFQVMHRYDKQVGTAPRTVRKTARSGTAPYTIPALHKHEHDVSPKNGAFGDRALQPLALAPRQARGDKIIMSW